MAQQRGKTTITRGNYLQTTRRIHGRTRNRPCVAALVQDQLQRPRLAESDVAAPDLALRTPQVAATDGQPPGFGTLVSWDSDNDLAVLAIVNAHDQYGLCVTGVRDGDTYEHIAAVGTASFSTETKNNGIAGLITVVEVGAGVAATAFGLPEIAPLIHAAGEYARKQFPESENPSKSRDAYGIAIGDGGKARQEGGVIVCEPSAQGIYHSANGDNRSYWIKEPGIRDDAHNPEHIPRNHAFFLRRGMTSRQLHGNGDLFISAWDFSFLDNSGFYQVHAILRRSDRDTQTPIE